MRTILVAMLCLGAAGCKDEPASAQPAPGQGESKPVGNPGAAKPAAAAGALTPDEVDASKALPAAELHAAMQAWKWDGKRVAVIGFCRVLGEAPAADCTSLAPDAQRTDTAVSVKYASPPAGTVAAETPVVVEGTIADAGMWSHVVLVDAKLVGAAPAAAAEKPTPWGVVPSRPVAAAALRRAQTAWDGVEVTVIGYYHSHTTSTNDHGTSIRVDLTDKAMGPRLVGCQVDREPLADIATRRDGVVARGKIRVQPFSDEVELASCSLVNR